MQGPAVSHARARRKTAWPFVAAGVALAGFAAPAAAADLAPPPAPPVFSWSGLYIGFNSGYAWRNSGAFSTQAVNSFDSPVATGFPGLPVIPHLWGPASALGANGEVGTRLNGFFSGGQLGYNWQFQNGAVVAGFEADAQGAGIRGGGGFQTLVQAAIYPPFVAATSVSVDRHLEYVGTVRGRFGYAVSPTIMVYATGGLAYGGVATDTTVRQSLTPSLLLSAGARSDFFENRVGWTVGGGVESALTGEISAKLEFLYYDLGAVNVGAQNGGPLIHTALVGEGVVGNAISSSTRFNGFAIRAGLNYRFAGSAPAADGVASLLTMPQFTAAAPPVLGDWQVTAMPYLWALGLNGATTARGESLGDNLSFIDLFTKTSAPPLAAAARFETRNGPFTVYGDYFWAQLRASGSALTLRTPFTGAALAVNADGHLKFNTKAILEGGAAYEVARWSTGSSSYTAIDALAGVRYWNISAQVGLDITGTLNVPLLGLSQAGQRAFAQSGDLSWVDPLVGLRVRQQLAPGEEFQLKGDIGGFGAGSKISRQAVGAYTHDFQFSGLNCQGMIGYRALEVDYSQGSGTRQSGLNAVLHGPIAGVGLRF